MHVKAVVLKNVAFLDVTQCSLVENVSAIEFQDYVFSLHVMKSHRGVKVHPHAFSALHGGEWLASRSGRFIPGERNFSTLLIGGWVQTITAQDV